jgi:hypothetical protein
LDIKYEDIINPKKNKRVAELLEKDKTREIPSNDKIKISSSNNFDQKFDENLTNNLNFDGNFKLDFLKVCQNISEDKSKKLKQNLSNSVSESGSYIDGLKLKDKNFSGGLFFEKGDLKLKNSNKDSKFQNLFGKIFKKDTNFVHINDLNTEQSSISEQMEQKEVELNSSEINNSIDKNDVIFQLKNRFDIKNISESDNEVEDKEELNEVEENDLESIENKSDLKSNILDEFKKIFSKE